MGRPGRWRRFVVRPLVWALALVALAVAASRVFLTSDLARERARALIAARLSDAVGRPVAIGGTDFALYPLRIVLTDVVVPGDRPGAADFARVRRLAIDGDLEGFRAPVLTLRHVSVEGLDLRLELREDGDNLPRPPRRQRGGSRLEVAIGGLTVEDARVHVDERTADVEVAAQSVLVRAWGVGGTDLEGTLTAQEVRLGLPDARPLAFAVTAKARLLGDRLEISNARVTSPDLAVRASGQVRWRGGTTVDLAVRAQGSGAVLDRLGYLDGDVAGPFEAEGTFGWRRAAWGWRAQVSSPALDLFGFHLDEVAGEASGDARAVRFALERGRFAGGPVAGDLEVALEAPRYPARLRVDALGADLQALLDRFEVPVRGLAGVVEGTLVYAFDLRDAERGEGGGEFAVTAGTGGAPAYGRASVRLAGGALELPDFELALPGQRIRGAARLPLAAGTGTVLLHARSADLGGLVRHVDFVDAGSLWAPTAGSGELDVRIELPAGGFRAEAAVDLRAVVAPGLAAERVRGRLVAVPAGVELAGFELSRAGARLVLAGFVPFEERRPQLALELTVEGWPVEEARPWLPFELPLAGRAHGTIRLGGSVASPTGELVASVAPAVVAGLGVQSLDAALGWDTRRLVVERARLVADAGVVEGEGELDFDSERLDFRLRSAGLDLAQPPITPLEAGRLAGRLVFAARLGGTLAAPAGELEGRVEELALDGVAAGTGPAPVSARLADGRLEASAELGELGRLTGGGVYRTDAPSRLDFTFTSEHLARLVALAAVEPLAGLDGRLVAELRLELVPGRAPALAIIVPELELTYAERTIRSLEPLVAVLDADGLELRSLYLGLPGSDDELFASGRLRFGDDPGLDFNLQASLSAVWLRPLATSFELDGRVEALARVRGTLARPEVSGQAEWSGGRVLPPVVPHTLEQAHALVLFYPDAVVLDRLEGAFAGGRLSAGGRLDLPVEGRALAYRFEASLREVTVRWPAGWQVAGDADLTLASTAGGRQLRGDVALERAWYLQDVDLSPAQLVQRLLARARVDVGVTDENLATTSLNLAIRAPGAVRVRNNVAALSGDADLVVRGSLARPVLFGEVVIEPGSTVVYGGNTYHLERALVTFANPTRIQPLLDVLARTRVDQYDVTLNVSGSLERLNTTFASDPPLPDLDILGLIATGAPVEGGPLGSQQPGEDRQSLAAGALLYGQAASLLTARVGRLFGFDQLRVQPLTSGDSISAARVTVSKRLSREVVVVYSHDPSSTAQQILQVEWRISDHLVLVLTQNGSESYAVDARWEARF